MISVLLPTIRPHLFRQAYESIGPAAGDVPYEVIIVADFGPQALPHCRWYVRARAGVVDAINYAYQQSQGAYVFLFNDESELAPDALRILRDAADATPECLLTPTHHPFFNFVYYDRLFAPFPFARRALIDAVNTSFVGLVDPIYKAYYHDSDLSHRLRASGRDVRIVPGADLYHHQNPQAAGAQDNIQTYLAADRAIYIPRWAHLGEFKDP